MFVTPSIIALLGCLSTALAAPTSCGRKSAAGGQYLHGNSTEFANLWGYGHGGNHGNHGQNHQSNVIDHPTTSQHVIETQSRAAVQTSQLVVQTSAAATSAAAPMPSDSSNGATGGSAGGGGAGGAGLGINYSSLFKAQNFPGLTWYWNWALTPSSDTGSLEFVPNVHSASNVDGVASAAASWTNVRYVLGFNEPDISASDGGSDIDPSTAAALHQQWVAALDGKYQIGTPAVARGGKTWMQQWLAACEGKCEYDFVPFHFYGTNAQDLISYAQDFYTTFQKPLWLTEWDCHDYSTGASCPDQAATELFMKTVVDWFKGEGSSMVHRWAWFGAFPGMSTDVNGLENSDGTANTLGDYYVSLAG
ncbi:glycosyl hydrolase catalytic core-domain-containing protein [Kockovaella imperatae]|uniref:Glycosyl hydrolase catalytic core-domain-containing protein n=1 Tax=Kockovaella imperatae TaxID=4999 RepID=A0A1Y1USD5_9TREE|nr:glycosyl hydrolase catalytic core-domain-containing protein [Kockovaella imperatae]ORX40547.1 glycosyl hydrolase catalytic core-domain-containing protein [Kockovaella imperatae]